MRRLSPTEPSMYRQIALLVLTSVALATPVFAQDADPVVVAETAAVLRTAVLDKEASLEVENVTVERPGATLHFEKGRIYALVREGEPTGAVFLGRGRVDFVLPAGVETRSWQVATDLSPLAQGFTAAYLRFSDGTAGELLTGDFSGPADRDGAAFRVFEQRSNVLDNPQWSDWAPHLLVDELIDRFGGGSDGGYFLAELRLESGGNWLSYLHNPRGALMHDETTAIYRARPQGQAPPDLDIVASFGATTRPGPDYDVLATDLEVVFPGKGPQGRDVVRAEVQSRIQILNPHEEPLSAVVMELEPERRLCVAQTDGRGIKVARVRDGNDKPLPVVHEANRLLIILPEPLAEGGIAQLKIDYGGPMTQGIPYTTPGGQSLPDTFFSELGPWAWYPRNPQTDRFAARIEIEVPKFIRAIASGDLLEEDETGDVWRYVYEDPGGVETLGLVVGALRHTKTKDQGSNPRIIVWGPQGTTIDLSASSAMIRAMIDFGEALWGPFPYQTLHIFEGVPYPMLNWQEGAEQRDGGGWSCLPPGHMRSWQGFVDGPSGLMLSGSPVTAPSYDITESRALDQLMVEPLEIDKYLRMAAIARQWWGHMTPPRTYRDSWLTESAASWTALMFLGRAGGKGPLAQRVLTMRRLAAEADGDAPPVLLGDRQGRWYPFQTWGRGTLLFSEFVERLGARPFLAGTKDLLRQGAGKGVGSDQFFAMIEELGGAAARDQALALAEGAPMPTLEYTSTIDRKSGEVVVEFAHIGEVFPASIVVEIRTGGGKVPITQRVMVDTPRKEVRITPPEGKARKVTIDPMNAALVRKLRKVGKLSPPESE